MFLASHLLGHILEAENRPIIFLSLEEVIELHETVLTWDGGLGGVRDMGLLTSAVMMPQQQFGAEFLHPDLASMAAAYLFHVCKNHPFLDGNKRAALGSAILFLIGNGVAVAIDQDQAADITLAVAAGEMSKEQLTAWFRSVLSQPKQP